MGNADVLDILSDKKVLYAEDEEGIRVNVAEILSLFFDKVVSVSDGQEAWDEMLLGSYDVLIFDICMPHMDGLEAIEKIRQTNKKIPIIILSAHTEHDYLWRTVELRITKYLTKPYDEHRFLEALSCAGLELVDENLNIRLKNGCIYNPYAKVICWGREHPTLQNRE